nr:hypothetical protein [Tanacetum cinerariifolium]
MPAACNVKSNGRPQSACHLIGPRFALAHGPLFFRPSIGPRVPPLGNGRPTSVFQATCLLGISRRFPSYIYVFIIFGAHTHFISSARLAFLLCFDIAEVSIFSFFYFVVPIFLYIYIWGDMSGSEADEMVPTSSKAVVFPKFDMHVYTSEHTSSELEAAVADYMIPMDLHPRLPPPGMMMDKLSSRYIGLYVEQLEQGGLRVPFSSFFLVVIKHFGVHVSQLLPMGVNQVILFEIRCLSLDVRPTVSLFWVFYKLCKQGHWFSFKNKTRRGTRKCFKEVTTSLKGWKRKIFLIDRRAIPDAMPWRHGDTDLHDDFPSNFNQDDVERLSEFLVPLRPPPRHLLYVCGLTTACRHPGLSYSIKYQDKNGNMGAGLRCLKRPLCCLLRNFFPFFAVISMDTFLKLPTWTGTIVSKGGPIPEDRRPKSRVTPPLPEGSKIPNLTAIQRNVEMPNTKIAVAREKKERQSLARAEAKRASVGHAGGSRKKQKRLAIVIPPEVTQEGPHVKKEVVDLSGNTCVSTPPATANQPSPPLGHHDTDKNPEYDTQSHQSSHQGHELVGNRYVPNWELQNDLRIYTYRVCRELVNHVATPAEDEFLGTLSNVELNHDYVDLRNHRNADLAELGRLRSGLRKANQDKDEMTKKFTLLDNACPERRNCQIWDLEPKTQQLMAAEEKVKMLEHERLALSAQLSQSEADRKKLVKEFIPTVVKRLHTSVEYRKSLAASVQLCFIVGWLGGLALGRTEEEVASFLSETHDLDIEGSETWEERHRVLFTTPYP